jgi:hypothetical protein
MDSDIFREDVIEAAGIFGLTPTHFGANSWSQLHKSEICKELSKAMVSFTGELFMNTPEIQDPELKVRLTADQVGISQQDATEVIKIAQGSGSTESRWKKAMIYLWERKYRIAAILAFLATLIWGLKSGSAQALGSQGWEGVKHGWELGKQGLTSGLSSLWEYAQMQAKYNALGTALGTGVAGITGAASNLKNRVFGQPMPELPMPEITRQYEKDQSLKSLNQTEPVALPQSRAFDLQPTDFDYGAA